MRGVRCEVRGEVWGAVRCSKVWSAAASPACGTTKILRAQKILREQKNTPQGTIGGVELGHGGRVLVEMLSLGLQVGGGLYNYSLNLVDFGGPRWAAAT